MNNVFKCITVGFLMIADFSMAATPAAGSQLPATDANQFAADLFTQIRSKPGNLCISPYGVSSALSMAVSGAAGKTSEQMLSVLHWTDQVKDLPAASHALTTSITASAIADKSIDDPKITIANALFGQQGYPYHKPFLDTLAIDFAAPFQQVDFISQPKQASDQINQWAAHQTHDKIKQAVPAAAINAQTRFILLNAIYFKAAWLHTFKKSATFNQPFYSEGSRSVSVPLMQQERGLPYLETDSFQAVELPYTGDFSMLVLLPKDRTALPALEKSMTQATFAGWIEKISPQLVQLYLPKFRIEGEYGLNQNLQSLGMTDAFDPSKADFTGMVSSGGIHIDKVLHKTFISVDEAGTEAAAVTAIAMVASAMAPRQKPVEPILFRADHPFVYVLRHRPTGAILFMGRLSDPR